VCLHGHAIEVRINAEDVAQDFAPQTGRISQLSVPSGVRWDSGVELGSVISPRYDSMIAKLIVHAADRERALEQLRGALDELLVAGLPTTAGLHRWLLDQEPLLQARLTTRFLDEAALPEPAEPRTVAPTAARVWASSAEPVPMGTAWTDIGPFRATPHTPTPRVFLRDAHGEIHEVVVETAGNRQVPPSAVQRADRTLAVNESGVTYAYSVVTRSDAWAPASDVGHGHAGALVAPFPALVNEVLVQAHDRVAGGDVLVVVEAMKMLHSLPAGGPGVVDAVRVSAGEQIESNQVLVTFVDSSDQTQEQRGQA
jgi:acetyl/propionyl-CoA carboxylase alpha subunit